MAMDGLRARFRGTPSARGAALERIVVAVVEPLDGVAVEPLVADLHPGAERAHRGKVLDREANRLGGGGKPAIAERLAGAALALRHEQLGGGLVIERHGRLASALRARG